MLAPGAGNSLAPLVLAAAFFAALAAIAPAGARWALILLLVVILGFVLFLAWFFRDPDRVPGPGIVSAADGHVQSVRREGDRWRIAVFMNVTDVHVNRFPVDAEVVSIRTSGSGFRPAYGEDAAHNVQRSYELTTPLGPVEVVQLTGIVARRLVSLVGVGESHRKGERLGMIVLGSRVDVYLPAAAATPTVVVGQRVFAGITPIAREGT